MAFKMNKAAFSFGQGTGSALTKSPLTKSPPMGSEADQRREAKLTKEGPAVSGEMDAVVVTPKMQEKREKEKEKEANKKAREEKRKNKKLARLDKKKARVEFGKDSEEFKEADEWLDAHKTGQNKVKAKVKETKGKVKAKVEETRDKVNKTVDKVKDKAKDLKSRITKSDEEKALKEQYKKNKKKAKTKRKNPDVTFHDAVKIDLGTGDAK